MRVVVELDSSSLLSRLAHLARSTGASMGEAAREVLLHALEQLPEAPAGTPLPPTPPARETAADRRKKAIVELLQAMPEGLFVKDLLGLLRCDRPALVVALQALLTSGVVVRTEVPSGGRPAHRYQLVVHKP